MRFGGFQSVSLSDFPGQAAAICFVQGCNFRCPFCHNGALLAEEGTGCFEIPTALRLLSERRRLLEGVVVSGGLRIKLDTNGSRPEMLELLLHESLLDYVAMDVKAPWPDYPRLTGGFQDIQAIQESIRLIVESGIACEFRTTFVPALMSKEALEQIRRQLPRGCRYKIQSFQPEHALDVSLRQSHFLEHEESL